MKLLKIFVLIIFTALISAGSTWYLTDNYYKNMEIPILTAKIASSPDNTIEFGQEVCQPNKMNGSCSKIIEGSILLTMNESSNKCNAYWKSQPKQEVIIRPQVPKMQFTNCNETYLGYSCYSY